MIDVPRPEVRLFASGGERPADGESSALVRKRVEEGIRFADRRGDPPGYRAIADLGLERDAAAALEKAAVIQGLSLRGVHKTARVARTIADLERSETIPCSAVLEALLFRAGSALTALKVA